MKKIDRELWRMLSPLLDRALDMSLGERVEWLHQLDAASPGIAIELRALLTCGAEADRHGFLAGRRGRNPTELPPRIASPRLTPAGDLVLPALGAHELHEPGPAA